MGERTSETAGTGNIRCPFFRAHGGKAIQCENLVPGSLATTISYRQNEDKRTQQALYCEGNYERCEMYLSIKHWQWTEDE